MSEYILQWNTLETIGHKGKGMNYRTDHVHNTSRFLLRYASITGLVLSALSFAMVMI